ncbi:hypothetical protein GALMADRAFT_249493 [Galerina marginata CBS 339.88]|uniref:NACHT domain-containing protein n=1 Tax=Galerina marginata (strain CBS 339.88) TaxID=685588 RepID=A0A067SX47_GALM3|nr:hypothetical protein GALMADRAFT_249493 [Galerina marginata CBS 339.88]
MAFQFNNVNIFGGSFTVVQGSSSEAPTIILRWSRPPNYINYFDIYKGARLQDTCQWSTRNDTIVKWLTSYEPDASFLWLCGKPGTGKSVLAAYLVEHVSHNRHESQDHIVLSYFCKAEGTQKHDLVYVIKGFIRQILLRRDRPYHEEVAHSLAQKILSEREDYIFTPQDLEPYLASFLQRFQKVWMIIDGLDECNDAPALINVLTNAASGHDAKFLFLSRKEVDIENFLRRKSTLVVEIGSEETTRDDLLHFIEVEVSSLVSHLPILSAHENRLNEGLVNTTGSMFLYARLKCQTIKEADPSTNAHVDAIMDSLESSPEDLDALFQVYLFQRLSHNTDYRNLVALRVLQWIRYSPGPVTAIFLQRALALDLSKDEGVDADKLDINIETTIAKALGILVEFRRRSEFAGTHASYASLMHHSLRDYLLRLETNFHHWENLKAPHNSILQKPSHAALLEACCIVTSNSRVWLGLQGYHESADWRRHLHANRTELLLKQLCREQSWQSWEHEQRRGLERDWLWRKEEQQRAEQEIADLSDGGEEMQEWLKCRKNQLQLFRIHDAQPQRGQELEKLVALTTLRERELMMYSFEYLPHHLIEAGKYRNGITSRAVSCMLPQMRIFAFNVLNGVDDNQWPKNPSQLASITDLVIALDSLSSMTHLIQLLLEHFPDEEISEGWPWSPFHQPVLHSLALTFPNDLFADQHSIWHEVILNSFKLNEPPFGFRIFFHMATIVILSMRDAELALRNYDHHMSAAVGTGVLLHSIAHLRHLFAQWTTVHDYEQGCEYRAQRRPLLAEDHFLFPKLLKKTVWMPATEPTELYATGIHIFDKDLFIRHPILFSTVLLLSLLMGFRNSQLLHLTIICTFLHKRRLYSFRMQNSPLVLRIARTLLPWLLVQQIILGHHHIYIPVMVGTIVLTALQVTKVVSCRYLNFRDSLYFTAEIVDVRLRQALIPMVKFGHIHRDFILTVVGSHEYFINSWTIVFVYIASQTTIDELIDPAGLRRVRVHFQDLLDGSNEAGQVSAYSPNSAYSLKTLRLT